MAVDEQSLGGWLMAWREIKAHGVDPYHHFSIRQFGGTHDAVVLAVWDGKAEAGTVRPDGTIRWIRTRAFPVKNEAGEIYRVAGLTEDITDRRMLEDQLRQAQKMEAVGQLAGGVAHDFNNLLSIVAGCSDLLSLDAEHLPTAQAHIDVIHATVKRGAALTRQLLAFSRRQIVAPSTLDLNIAVAELQSMLRRLLGEHIVLVTEADPNTCCIRADAGQIEQVILNLCVNARDAMPRGGTLEIRTRRMELIPEFANQHIGLEPGTHVALSVTDTGHGIDAETKVHLFEPFFTTKEPGKGSGLGLSTVYGIVKHSGGVIRVESHAGQGATFTIYFPMEPGVHETRPGEMPASSGRGVETILFVEDEDEVRTVFCQFLRMRGYTVIEACNGERALEISGRGDHIDLLIADMAMPGISGWERGQKIAGQRPTLRILYISGFTPEENARIGVESSAFAFWQKPFTAPLLEAKIREVLKNK